MKSDTSRKIARIFFFFFILRFHGSGSIVASWNICGETRTSSGQHWDLQHLSDGKAKLKRFIKTCINYDNISTYLFIPSSSCGVSRSVDDTTLAWSLSTVEELFSLAALHCKPNYNSGFT